MPPSTAPKALYAECKWIILRIFCGEWGTAIFNYRCSIWAMLDREESQPAPGSLSQPPRLLQSRSFSHFLNWVSADSHCAAVSCTHSPAHFKSHLYSCYSSCAFSKGYCNINSINLSFTAAIPLLPVLLSAYSSPLCSFPILFFSCTEGVVGLTGSELTVVTFLPPRQARRHLRVWLQIE